MIFQIRAGRDVTSKGPEGSGIRRRTVKLPRGSVTLVAGARPFYIEVDDLPPELARDRHLLIEEIAADSLPPGADVVNLKSERVQEELAVPGDGGEDVESAAESASPASPMASAPPPPEPEGSSHFTPATYPGGDSVADDSPTALGSPKASQSEASRPAPPLKPRGKR